MLDGWMWAREPKGADGQRGGVLESTRWTDGYTRIAERTASLPGTRLVYVADREADIVALMAHTRDPGHPADWLIRSQPNRALPEGGQLWACVTAGEALGGSASRCLPDRDKKRGRCGNGSGLRARRWPMAGAAGWT